jgi:prepilin-type N-terminal cleavage/methylation domain-containing protein
MSRPRHRHETPEEGFTLLEVLVATAILGTAVAALFSLLSGSLANARRLQSPERGLSLARMQMNELLAASDRGHGTSDGLAEALVLDHTKQGRWDDQFRWEALATRVKTPSQPAPGETILVRIALDAFWKSEASAREKHLTLETYQLWQEPPRSAP